MSHRLYRLLERLERGGFFYRIDRYRPDTITVIVTLVGARIEVDVFDDEHVECSRFVGDEGIEGDDADLERLLAKSADEDARLSAKLKPSE